MGRILGVIGSPRREGNTDTLVTRILEGAREVGAKTERLYLAGLQIRECEGCHACWKGKTCPRADDMLEVWPRIIDADVIVFGTPVYWYGPTALMKAFIDRFVYFNCPENRARIAGKPAAVAIPYEETDPETVRPVVQFFEKCLNYLEMNLVEKIIVPGVAARGEILGKTASLEQAHALGKSLAGSSGASGRV